MAALLVDGKQLMKPTICCCDCCCGWCCWGISDNLEVATEPAAPIAASCCCWSLIGAIAKSCGCCSCCCCTLDEVVAVVVDDVREEGDTAGGVGSCCMCPTSMAAGCWGGGGGGAGDGAGSGCKFGLAWNDIELEKQVSSMLKDLLVTCAWGCCGCTRAVIGDWTMIVASEKSELSRYL